MPLRERLPERLREPRALALAIVAVVVVLVVGIWGLVAIIGPTVEDLPCAGVSFHAPVQTDPAPSDGKPPIGGSGGVAGGVRKLFTGQGAVVYCHDFADPFVVRDGDAVLRVLHQHRHGQRPGAHCRRALREPVAS